MSEDWIRAANGESFGRGFELVANTKNVTAIHAITKTFSVETIWLTDYSMSDKQL